MDIGFLLIAQGDLDQAQRYLGEKRSTCWSKRKPGTIYSIRKYLYRAQVEYNARPAFRGPRRSCRTLKPPIAAPNSISPKLCRNPVDARQASRRWSLEVVRDNMIASQGVVKAKQGRFAEAEADARRALLNRLASVGKYNLTTATLIIPRFANILLDQGRYGEAEKLTRTQIDIFKTLGVDSDSQYFVEALKNLASMQALQGRWSKRRELMPPSIRRPNPGMLHARRNWSISTGC